MNEIEPHQKHIHITFTGPSRRQLLIIVGGAALTIALVITAILYIRQYTALTGLPKNSYQNLNFPVYFPRPMARDFQLDPKSVSTKSDVIAYTLMYQKTHPVYISIQPLDPDLDTNSFHPTRTLTLSIGKGYLVEYDTRVTIAVITNKSLILINSADSVPSYDMENLADNLQPAE